jgi:hypothetical protein
MRTSAACDDSFWLRFSTRVLTNPRHGDDTSKRIPSPNRVVR